MKVKKLAASVAGVVLAASTLSGCSGSDMRNISTMELVNDMGIGINLGNTFEACGDWINDKSVTNYETGWGSPIITKEMICGYADSGFGVLRIPVAWSNMMGEDYTINPEYIARVKEVIDWAIDADMYVIMNIHWDGGWWENFPNDKEECMYKYKRIWIQLCDEFKNYNDYLMFESLNEEGVWDSIWNRYGGSDDEKKAEAYGLLNEINQTFVDIVRNSDGNNKKRHLLIAGYATDIELTCDELFKMPDDPQNRCAVSVHYYTPSTFCILTADADWGKAKTDWGSQEDYDELQKYMSMMKENFIDNNIPVIIGEYGVATENKSADTVRTFLSAVCSQAYEYGMCPVLWDTTDAFYSRSECKMIDSELINMLIEAKN